MLRRVKAGKFLVGSVPDDPAPRVEPAGLFLAVVSVLSLSDIEMRSGEAAPVSNAAVFDSPLPLPTSSITPTPSLAPATITPGLGVVTSTVIITAAETTIDARGGRVTSAEGRGQAAEQSVPYAVANTATNGLSYYQTPDRNQPSTKTAYDALGRAVVITNTDGTTLTTKFKGRQTATRDANGHLRIGEVDASGRLISMREYMQTVGSLALATFDLPAYATTRYTYDMLGNLKVVTDALQNTTLINYDALGRKTNMTDPDMGFWQYQYDAAGNLIQQTDAKNQVLWFNYDPLNRLTEKRQTNSGGLLLASYTYDQGPNGIGRRTRLADPSGWATWTYDNRGRVTQETRAITLNNTSNVFTTGFGYDAMDRVITTTYPTGEVVTQTYNALGALENMRSASSDDPYLNQWYVKNLDYNAQGALTLAQLGNNLTTNYTYYTNTFRLQALSVNNLYQLQYGYDNVGNVTSWAAQYQAPLPALSESMQYEYDALDRLTRAISITSGYTGTYTYDPIGNLVTRNINSTIVTYGYTATNKPHAVRSLTSGEQYDYDANGNMTARTENGVTYQQEWDRENRLLVVTNTNTLSVTRFVYDGAGARVAQIKPDGTAVAYVGNLLEVEFVAPPAPPRI
jgi:YD repeat-containing protein